MHIRPCWRRGGRPTMPIPYRSHTMQTKTLMRAIAMSLALATAAMSAQAADPPTAPTSATDLQVQQIRNPTPKIVSAGQTFLIYALLRTTSAYPRFKGTFHSQLRSPCHAPPRAARENSEESKGGTCRV